jgi:HAD superfamily hydrolase (TIGR01509 family)
LQKDIYDTYRRMLVRDLRAMPGAIEAVKRLAGQFVLAIASSSRREFIDFALRRFKLEPYFSVIVSRESTRRLKPDPDCLMMVLHALELKPEQCVFIEDAQRGLKAAAAIGMPCIIVPNQLTAGADYEGAAIVVGALSEVTPQLIRSIKI